MLLEPAEKEDRESEGDRGCEKGGGLEGWSEGNNYGEAGK